MRSVVKCSFANDVYSQSEPTSDSLCLMASQICQIIYQSTNSSRGHIYIFHPHDMRTGEACNPQVLKEVFSDFNNIISWHESEEVNQKKKKKKLISKISVDSSFTFSSYAWLCVLLP